MNWTPVQEKFNRIMGIDVEKLEVVCLYETIKLLSKQRRRRLYAMVIFFEWCEGTDSGLPFLGFIFWWLYGAWEYSIFDPKSYIESLSDGWQHMIYPKGRWD